MTTTRNISDNDQPVNLNIQSEQDFSEVLNILLRLAYANGINVEGGWECRNDGDSYPDWEAVIVSMTKPGE